MTNFNFLLSDPQLTTFGEVAVAAERIYTIDPAACVLNCRRCMEFAVKWMYSVDGGLVMPYDDRLASLMDTEDFRAIVDRDLWQRLKYIRQTGNAAAHTGKKITKEQAMLCLENLWYFMDFVACCYGTTYTPGEFDPALLEGQTAAPAPAPVPEVDLAALMAENAALRAELTARRETQQPSYTPKPLDLSEYKTRKLYIDAMLTDAGWTEGKDWLGEVELPGMPNQSEVGYADYVLYDDAHRPLAVIEAKRTCVDPAKGRQQAKLYADLLEQKYGRRPVIFLTNGFDTRIDDGAYFGPEPPEGPAGHGHRLGQDPHGHRSGGCTPPARLGEKCPLPGRPKLSGHPGQAQLCESAAQSLRDQPVRGEGQLHGPLRLFYLPDHDELHRLG